MLAQAFHDLPLAGCSALTPNDLGSFFHHLHYNKTTTPSCKQQLCYTRKEPTSWEPHTKFNIDGKVPWTHVQVTGTATALCSFAQLFQLVRIHGVHFPFSLGKIKHSVEVFQQYRSSCPPKYTEQFMHTWECFTAAITALLEYFVRKMTTLAYSSQDLLCNFSSPAVKENWEFDWNSFLQKVLLFLKAGRKMGWV